MSRRAAVWLLGCAVIGVSALAGLAYGRRGPGAEELFRLAYTGRHPSFQAYATVGAAIGGRWVEREATVVRGVGCAQACVQVAEGTRMLYDDGTALWEAADGAGPVPVRAPSSQGRGIGHTLSNYDVADLGVANVSGIDTRVVELRSKHDGHPALRAWIDPATNITLAEERYDCSGRLVAHVVIRGLITVAQPAPSPAPPAAASQSGDPMPDHLTARTSHESFVADYGFDPPSPRYVPAGFAEEGLYVRTCPRGRAFAEVRYSDGLRTLSVFARSRRGGAGQQGKGFGPGRRWAEILVVSDASSVKTARVARGEYDIAVVGDVPESELRRVLESCDPGP